VLHALGAGSVEIGGISQIFAQKLRIPLAYNNIKKQKRSMTTQQSRTSLKHYSRTLSQRSLVKMIVMATQSPFTTNTYKTRHTKSSGPQTRMQIQTSSWSTCSVFRNKDLLTNIRKSNSTLRAYTNGGYQDSHEIAMLPGYFEVWYNPNSMVNILVYADVRK
jgi:hypothetical protein